MVSKQKNEGLAERKRRGRFSSRYTRRNILGKEMRFDKDRGEIFREQRGVRLTWQKGREAAGLKEWEQKVGLE